MNPPLKHYHPSLSLSLCSLKMEKKLDAHQRWKRVITIEMVMLADKSTGADNPKRDYKSPA